MFNDLLIANPANSGIDLQTRINAMQSFLSGGDSFTLVAPVVTPTGGASTDYSYVVVAVLGNSQAPSPATQTTGGAATLSASAYNTINWNPVQPNNPNVTYNIYRSASSGTPSSTGLIGSVAQGTFSFVDNGIAGNSATVPSLNTTGIGIVSPNVDQLQTITLAGAITIIGGRVLLNPSGVIAVTLGLPVAGSAAGGGNDGCVLNITDTTGHASTVTTPTNGYATGGIVGNHHVYTFGGTAASTFSIVALNGVWIPTGLASGSIS